MNTTPVTGEIEAGLREIMAEELGAEFVTLGIEKSKPPTAKMFENNVFAPYVRAMKRAYALDRASGDGVRVDTDANVEIAAEAMYVSEYGDRLAEFPKWAELKPQTNGSYWRRLARAALSAVSIPRGEVETPDLGNWFPDARKRMREICILVDNATNTCTDSEESPCTPDDCYIAELCALHRNAREPLPPAGGWRLVPREPTREMLEACLPLDDDHMDTDHIWRAMFDAVPARYHTVER